jgi:O-succinylbenzoic acid--CoA ligase
VERALKPYIHVPYAITRRADKKFGEIVVLLVQSPDVSEAETICKRVLPKYWQPRLYVSVDEIPMTETGKIKRKVKG